jgi:uncharacterized 2Fe-2S/4Fe-4S cluster protein (DUF4445 family)
LSSNVVRDGTTFVYGGGCLLGSEDGVTTGEPFAIALDIGTTTLAAVLIDLNRGKTAAGDSALNPQTMYAQDVMGRIQFAGTGNGLTVLSGAFSGALENMIRSLTQSAGVKRERIYEVVYSGNTVMLHLACGINPRSLGSAPYTPEISGGNHVSAGGLGIFPFGLVWLPPVISAWIGADISSGIIAAGLAEKKGVCLFIDIGTNGELVLAKDGALASASTAAGPAFEGVNISCGMRAGPGAIESFRFTGGGMSFTLVGANGESVPGDSGSVTPTSAPKGICGSGLIDIIAELVRTGMVDPGGKFADNRESFSIAGGVYLGQKDIRQIQLAKGAIRCGVEALLARFGLRAAGVDSVEIAGAFGYHLNEESLTGIGLLPREFRGKIHFAGNTSLHGAASFLLDTAARAKIIKLVKQVDYVDLTKEKDFQEKFVDSLGF